MPVVLFSSAPKFRDWSTTLEIKNDSSAIGQKGRTVRCDIDKRSKETRSGEPFVPNEDENTKYKKVYFCANLFKNTIFITYEWWLFQRYRICLKKSEIRIGKKK